MPLVDLSGHESVMNWDDTVVCGDQSEGRLAVSEWEVVDWCVCSDGDNDGGSVGG